MIKTQFDRNDTTGILNLGRQLHQESRFNGTSFDEPKCLMLLEQTLKYPHRVFIAYDDQFQGLLILQMSTQFFNDDMWAGDQAFYVTPEARGSGLAQQLITVGETWAKSEGATELVILHNAGIGLDTAEKFYNKLGLTLSGLIFNKRIV